MNNKFFKELVAIMNGCKCDAELPANATELKFVDPAHVTMAKIESQSPYIVAEGVEGYVLDRNACKGIKLGKKDGVLLTDRAGEHLLLSTTAGVSNYKIGDVAGYYGRVRIPELDPLQVAFRMKYDDFKSILDGVKSVNADYLRIYSNGAHATFKTWDATGDQCIFDKTMPVECIRDYDEVSSAFPLSYLTAIMKSNLNKDDFFIELSKDYPVRMSWIFNDDGGERHSITWLLAPRIESN